MTRNLLLLGVVGCGVLGGCGAPDWSVADRSTAQNGGSGTAPSNAGGATPGGGGGSGGNIGDLAADGGAADGGAADGAGTTGGAPTMTMSGGASSSAGTGSASGGVGGEGARSGSAGSSLGGQRSAGGNNGGAGRGAAAGSSAGGIGGKAGASSAGAGGAGPSGGAGTNTDYLKTRTRNYGFVDLTASSKNQILSLATTLTVPIKPNAKTGTLFLWPGLQPGGENFLPIDNGVLQPVLTWGGTCAPNAPKSAYLSWWISAQYVNTFGKDPGYTGCLGGPGMNVQVGDPLQLIMTLNGTIWRQTVTDPVTNQSVSFDIDMLGQAQNHAEFDIEIYSEPPVSDVVFTATTITFATAEAAACQPTTRGMNDFFTNPKASADGKQCVIDRIALRAQGVPATSPN